MNDSQPSIQRIAELQQFIAGFARIERIPQLADCGRPENDVEHSYGLALTSWFLAGHIAPHLDIAKIFKYALAHDTVEVFAGDTFVFGPKEALLSKSKREDQAIIRLRKDWSDFPELADYAQAYKEHADEEARFVYAIDKILPVLKVNLGEKDAFWNRHKITAEMQKIEKEAKMKVSKEIAHYYDELVAWMTEPDYFYRPSPAD